MKRVLILSLSSAEGAAIGTAIQNQYFVYGSFWDHRLNFESITPARIDLTKKDSLEKIILQTQPDVIIYCPPVLGYYHSIQDPDLIDAFLVKALLNISYSADRIDAKLIFLSSATVFSGENPPYLETATTNPLSILGGFYSQGEGMIFKSMQKYVILRTGLFWSESLSMRRTFLDYLVSSLENGLNVKVDQRYKVNIYTPSLLAEVISYLVQSDDHEKIYNIGSSDALDQATLAKLFCQKQGYSSDLIVPVDVEFPRDKRKYYDREYKDRRCFQLDTSKLENLLGKKISSSKEMIFGSDFTEQKSE